MSSDRHLGAASLLALASMGGHAEGSFLENAPYFVFGVAFYYWLSRGSERWLPGAFCFSACAFAAANLLGRAATFGSDPVPRDRLGELLLLTVLTLAFVGLAFIPEGRSRTARRLMDLDRFFGELTYPLYLLHWCVLVAARTWLLHGGWAAATLAFGLSYLLAALTVAVVERPVARLRTLVRRRRAPVEDAGVAATTST